MSKLDEWKCATDSAMHFNDLLMRLRMLGLPMVITIIGVGMFVLGEGNSITFYEGLVDIVGLIIGLVIFIFVLVSRFREDWKPNHNFPVPLYRWEFVCWILVPFTIIVYFSLAVVFDIFLDKGFYTYKEYPIGALIILAGLALLSALYALDRFYYYKLLVGAINRATELEPQLGFKLTERISRSITQPQATRLITWFYWVPGFMTLVGFLIIIQVLELN